MIGIRIGRLIDGCQITGHSVFPDPVGALRQPLLEHVMTEPVGREGHLGGRSGIRRIVPVRPGAVVQLPLEHHINAFQRITGDHGIRLVVQFPAGQADSVVIGPVTILVHMHDRVLGGDVHDPQRALIITQMPSAVVRVGDVPGIAFLIRRQSLGRAGALSQDIVRVVEHPAGHIRFIGLGIHEHEIEIEGALGRSEALGLAGLYCGHLEHIDRVLLAILLDRVSNNQIGDIDLLGILSIVVRFVVHKVVLERSRIIRILMPHHQAVGCTLGSGQPGLAHVKTDSQSEQRFRVTVTIQVEVEVHVGQGLVIMGEVAVRAEFILPLGNAQGSQESLGFTRAHDLGIKDIVVIDLIHDILGAPADDTAI